MKPKTIRLSSAMRTRFTEIEANFVMLSQKNGHIKALEEILISLKDEKLQKTETIKSAMEWIILQIDLDSESVWNKRMKDGAVVRSDQTILQSLIGFCYEAVMLKNYGLPRFRFFTDDVQDKEFKNSHKDHIDILLDVFDIKDRINCFV